MTMPPTTPGLPPEPQIVPCNFRSAGRLSNDSIRHLRTMHDTFARNVSHSLDLYLGSPIEIKLVNVEQIGAREFVTSLAPGSYLVPFAIMPLQNRVIARFDNALLFPLLDLLLGGTGDSLDVLRELTEIDEELIRSVTELIGVQLERTWKACLVNVTPSASIKSALLGQMFVTEERIVALNFELSLARTTAGMQIILPLAFCNALVRSTHPDATRILGGDAGTLLPLRERILDCEMLVSAELTGLAISVGELIAMEAGTVLDMHASVATAVRLQIDQYPLFEATPVRRGGRKTAQLGRPCHQQDGVQG